MHTEASGQLGAVCRWLERASRWRHARRRLLHSFLREQQDQDVLSLTLTLMTGGVLGNRGHAATHPATGPHPVRQHASRAFLRQAEPHHAHELPSLADAAAEALGRLTRVCGRCTTLLQASADPEYRLLLDRLRAISAAIPPEDDTTVTWFGRMLAGDVPQAAGFALALVDALGREVAGLPDDARASGDLYRGARSVPSDEVALFQYFRPHLSARPASGASFRAALLSMKGRLLVERKYDGERLQAHFARPGTGSGLGAGWRFWSRRGVDWTARLAGRVLADHLTAALAGSVTDVILDGELIAWCPVARRILPFSFVRPASSGGTQGIRSLWLTPAPSPCWA
ncbi:hypothetical protein H696_06236 [Fonticula alba]|uniref:ATP-dependent DNA ligase family profile domain-containing protein n=1 Tax=Fonticula alba TaxID=691883 RepID=A0A058Z1D3_FONAL|nr:hypothetical protein H696_06236 [Fonticula alba]KCV67337.1 hypothetical protein H696_06236 [Fonticula alba]|eukprot:XP_009498259.1 hypothetical protein H696_06236 [Fonticula alba]